MKRLGNPLMARLKKLIDNHAAWRSRIDDRRHTLESCVTSIVFPATALHGPEQRVWLSTPFKGCTTCCRRGPAVLRAAVRNLMLEKNSDAAPKAAPGLLPKMPALDTTIYSYFRIDRKLGVCWKAESSARTPISTHSRRRRSCTQRCCFLSA